jgi:cell division protein FtsW
VSPLLALAFVLLVLVLVPPFGQSINGTRRWLRWGPISVQPTELAKLVLVVYLADFLARRHAVIGNLWRGILPPLMVTGGVAGLVLLQPDLGSAVAIVGVVLCMIFVAGARLAHLGMIGGLAVPVVALAVYMAPYRLRRVLTFLDPWADPRGAGFQIIQSYLALGGGGFLGRGLGESKQKLFYLPEPHTDFIFAVLGEEWGFIGVSIVLALYLFLIVQALTFAKNARDRGGTFLAICLIAFFIFHVLINVSMQIGVLPTTGIPLPLISYGGSSTMMFFMAIGLMLNVDRGRFGSA